jgi:hypothetical protein
LGKSGWFYVSTEDYFPSEYHSNTGEINGVLVTELYPDDIVLTHSWYLIDNSGQSSEEVGYMVGQEGIIYNRAVTTAGKVVMLDLVGSDPNAIQNAPPRPNTKAYV